MRDRKLLARLLLAAVAILSVVVLTACERIFGPAHPSPEVNVLVNQTVTQGPAPSPSPSPGATTCNPTTLNMGTFGDDYTLQAGGTDTVKLVVSFYQNLLELPPLCTDTLSPTFTPTGNAGCTISGPGLENGIRFWAVRAASPGACSITAKLPAIPASNPVDLTVTP